MSDDHPADHDPTATFNALPVAGNFDGNAANGDEVGLFDGTTWYFDTNHDGHDRSRRSQCPARSPAIRSWATSTATATSTWAPTATARSTSSCGTPGPATYSITVQTLSLYGTGLPQLGANAAGCRRYGSGRHHRHRPVHAGRQRGHGHAGLGMVLVRLRTLQHRLPATVTAIQRQHPDRKFRQTPLGNDLFAKFGNNYAMPIVGNFDPPANAIAISQPTPPSSGPTISGIVVATSANPPVITWSATDTAGVTETTLQVDGKLVSTVYGPFGTNYAGLLPTLTAGSHTYIIQATNGAPTPVTTEYVGTFSVVTTNQAPTISNVVVATSAKPPVITWSVADSDGIASTSLTVDGKSVSTIYGPYGTKYAANYAGVWVLLAAGNHTYVIHATDSAGTPASTDYTGSFTVASQSALTNPAPTIGNVVVSLTSNPPVITWSAADADGIASTSLMVDGKSVSTIYGPYGTKYAANYAGVLGTLAAGNHTYVIHATDSAGTPASTDYTGSFTVAAPRP